MCSNFIKKADAKAHTKVPVWVKKGTMTFPKNAPLIMVGPGTGVAAFRSVIQELKSPNQELVLIFGCRSEASDYYYKEDWA